MYSLRRTHFCIYCTFDWLTGKNKQKTQLYFCLYVSPKKEKFRLSKFSSIDVIKKTKEHNNFTLKIYVHK